MDAHALTDMLAEHASIGQPYLEFLRSQALSVGLYVLPAGGIDRQQPHGEDEIYVIMSGHARFTAGNDVRDVNPGDVIFVPARVPHCFHDIGQELILIVVFAPPESAPSDPAAS